MTLREIHTQRGALVPETPPSTPSVDRFKGCILGCALGDVVGAWAEAKPAAVAREYVEHCVTAFDFTSVGAHHRGSVFGQYTDDTQLTRELSISICQNKGWVPEDFASRIAVAFKEGRVVGAGRATAEAADRLSQGVAWDQAGTPPPRAGNGAAMRAAPVGLFWWNDLKRLTIMASEQAIITHQARTSVAGSVALAAAVGMCLNSSRDTSGPHELGWWRWLSRFVGSLNQEFGRDIDQLATMVFSGRKTGRRPGGLLEYESTLEWLLEEDDSNWEGISPWARTSVLWSFYCLMSHPANLWDAIALSILPGGDVDTTAAMTGALVGAQVGLKNFPNQAIEKIAPLVHDAKTPNWGWEALEKLAEDLHAVVDQRASVP